jgi:hypothetical protein
MAHHLRLRLAPIPSVGVRRQTVYGD